MADPYDQDDRDIMGFSQLSPSQRREKDVFKRRMARLQQFKEQASNLGSELSRREENAWINHGTPIDWEMHRPSNEVVAEQIEAKTGGPKEEFTDVSAAEQQSILERTRIAAPMAKLTSPIFFHPDLLKELYEIKENRGLLAKTAYTAAIAGGALTPADKIFDTMELQMAIVTGDDKLLGEASFGFMPVGDATKAAGRTAGIIADYKDQYASDLSEEELKKMDMYEVYIQGKSDMPGEILTMSSDIYDDVLTMFGEEINQKALKKLFGLSYGEGNLSEAYLEAIQPLTLFDSLAESPNK